VDFDPTSIPQASLGEPSDDFFDVAARELESSERQALLRNRQDIEERLRFLTESRQRLLLLLEVSGAINSVLSTTEVLERVMDAVLAISTASRGFLVLLDSTGQSRMEISRSLDDSEEISEDTLKISQTILKQAIDTGRTVWVSDALSNPAFTNHQSVKDLSLRTIICLPLKIDQKVLGAIYLDSRTVTDLVAGDGMTLLEAFASQAAAAISNARSHDALKSFQTRLEVENRSLKRAMRSEFSFESILGRSPAMQRVFDILERVVDNPVTVLILGETGTGKELVARAIHNSGPRRSQNFVAINCGALPENLLESELFGYRRGAFTGAAEDRPGLFEMAHGGTIFLDEIGELPLPLQVKLLRVIQESEVRRLGDTVSRRVDARLLVATNRKLEEEVTEGRFRQDLFYRLNVVNVTLPPLRERYEDMLDLADHFLRKSSARMGRSGLYLTSEAKNCILAHSWPGNVRELENSLERACALANGDAITPEHLVPSAPTFSTEDDTTLRKVLQQAERATIEAALRRSAGNISRAAVALGVSRQHLHNRIRKLKVVAVRPTHA
jgi:Nif-specific regulatory protein